MPTKLLVVDDHILFREGLSRLLAYETDFEVVGHCGTAAEALEVLERTPVDLLLLDFAIGKDHGAQLISTARTSGYSGKILMVTAGMTARESSMALKLGASGIFLKHSSPASLVQAIRLVISGEMWVDQKVSQLIAEEVQQHEETTAGLSLTGREQQVLQGLFEGLANDEIATRLAVTEGAVKACLQQLFEKTGVRTRSQLVRIALEGSLGTTQKH
jgi:DNA-binding NarL/FixJ family response regulator